MNFLLLALVFTLPPSLEQKRPEIAQLVVERTQEFRTACYKWQKARRCNLVARDAVINIIDDYKFPLNGTASGTAHGQYLRLKNIKESYYNILFASTKEACTGIHVRTRQQMYEFSNRNRFWLDKFPDGYFCGNPNSLLASMVHEMCHYFGRKVGHVEGKAECQS